MDKSVCPFCGAKWDGPTTFIEPAPTYNKYSCDTIIKASGIVSYRSSRCYKTELSHLHSLITKVVPFIDCLTRQSENEGIDYQMYLDAVELFPDLLAVRGKEWE